MARPSVVTDAVKAAIARLGGPGVTLAVLRSRLAAEGHAVSVATLSRHLGARPRLEGATPAAVARHARAALASDDLAELRAAQAEVARARQGWAPFLGTDPRAVRAYAALAKLQKEITASIVELTPRPEADRYAPIESAALAELLERCEGAARAEARALARLASFERLLADGRLVATEG